MPVVVITVLTMSLIEVFFILPAHLSHGRPWSGWPLNVFQAKVSAGVKRFRDNILVTAIAAAVRHRYWTLLGGLGLLAVASALVLMGVVRFIFFPDLESNRMRADIGFPVGTPFEVTPRRGREGGRCRLCHQRGGGRHVLPFH